MINKAAIDIENCNEIASTQANVDLYQYHFQLLSNFVYGKVKCKDLSQDIMQELYLKLAKMPDVTTIKKPKNYLMQMACRLISDHFRKASNLHETGHDSIFEKISQDNNSPETEQINKDLLDKLQVALNKLPPEKRDIVLLHRVNGWSYREIAAQKKRSLSWVEKSVADTMLLLEQFKQQNRSE
ncbi:RNA polymerase sigma factor [Catenovulum sediminis]|uniref:RNA polymerase sigma factor n=1 Tax=Catenovulum sediminis TaxID=1740262 RepID=A0ABV1RFW4_9ALTE